MAQRPTPEETAARHRAKLAQHTFVEKPGSRLCGAAVPKFDPLMLSTTIASAMTGYTGPGADLGPELVACNRPRRAHVSD